MSRAEATRTVGWLRRRMPRHLLPALCLSLLLLGCACGHGYTADGSPVKRVALFAAGKTKVPANVGSKESTRDVNSFDSPFLAAGGGVMVALAEAECTGRGENNVGIVARYTETEVEGWASNAVRDKGNWKTQLALQGKAGMNYCVLRNPTAVIKGNAIYLLALTNWTNDSSQSDDSWYFELSVGAITGEVGSKEIEWRPSESLHSKLTQEVEKKHLKVFPGSNNSAFLTSNGTIVFSVSATNTEGAKGNAILQLKDGEEQWKVSFVEKPKGCRDFSLFEWKERLVSVFSSCPRDTNYVKEYVEVEEEWKDADDTLFLPWGSKHGSRDLNPVTIGNKTVLLFTKESTIQLEFGGGYRFFLFFTDGNRVYGRVGRINAQSARTAFGKLLYTNGELFFIYQDVNKPSGNIVFQRLNRQLEKIESTLSTWDENDAYLSKPCNETAPKDASPGTFCVTPMPTAGLVSFFSDSSGSSYWGDEYHFRNAWVNGGRKVKNGYTFSGVGEGVQWRFDDGGAMGKGYDFLKYGLTVVATMTLHETPEKDIPLLAVGGVLDPNRLGLWYKDKQWKVVSMNGEEESAVDFVTQKTHRVALIVHNNTISVYVDGKSLLRPLPISALGVDPFDGKSVFIGRYLSGGKIHMTVTNLLIYKRVLSDTELEAASKRIVTETLTDSKKTPELPTDPKEDSSEHMRVGATLLFLLGLRALALLFLAPI